MSSTSTTRLGLFKPTPGTAEPFRTSDLNSNSDKIDAEAVLVDGRLDSLELKVGASGTVVNATNAVNATTAVSATTASSATTATSAGKATNVAGGSGTFPKLLKQTNVDTTDFVANGVSGQILFQGFAGPSFGYPVPYRLEAGTASGTGSIAVTFGTAFDVGVVPVVSCVASANTTPTILTVTSVSNTGFTIKVWDQSASSPFQFGAAGSSRTVYWSAMQVSP